MSEHKHFDEKDYDLETLVGEVDLDPVSALKEVREDLVSLPTKIYEYSIAIQTYCFSKISDVKKWMIVADRESYIQKIKDQRKTWGARRVEKEHQKKKQGIIYRELRLEKMPILFSYLLSKKSSLANEDSKRALEVALSSVAVFHWPGYVRRVAKHFKLNEMRIYRDGLIFEAGIGNITSIPALYIGLKKGDLISNIINTYTPFNVGNFHISESHILPLIIGASVVMQADIIRRYEILRIRKPSRSWTNYLKPTAWPVTFGLLLGEAGMKAEQVLDAFNAAIVGGEENLIRKRMSEDLGNYSLKEKYSNSSI